jgi:hypothetical protein
VVAAPPSFEPLARQDEGGKMRALLLVIAIFVPQLVLASESSVVIAVGYASSVPPVRVQTRADYLAVPVSVQSDTKDPLKRIDQIENALRSLADRVKQQGDLAIRPGSVSLSPRDTAKSFISYEPSPAPPVQLYLLASLKPETSVFALTKRIHQLVVANPAPDGVRLVVGNTTLGVNDPEKFRPQLLGLIAKSVADTRKILGANGSTELDGLENPIAVMVVNETDVMLFINFRVKIQMRPT